MKIEIDFEGAGRFGGQACKCLFSVLTLNCETDEFEEGKGHQACTCAYMPVRRSSHAGPGSRWGGHLGTRSAFVIR